jgi:hypothetical protein
MEIYLLGFVEQYRDLVKQALGKHAGELASTGTEKTKPVV